MLDIDEIEGCALALYRRAELDPVTQYGAIRLACALGIDVEFVRRLRAACMRAANDNARPVIQIDDRAPLAAREWMCAHELGHEATRRRSYAAYESGLERTCSSIGAAIVVPRAALFRARSAHGFDLEALAAEFSTTETVIGLRWGDVFDDAVALLTPSGIWRRGPDVLPPDRELRRLVAAGGDERCRVVPITDAPGRALVAAA